MVVRQNKSRQTPDGGVRPPVPGAGVIPGVGEVLREVWIDRRTTRVPASEEQAPLISVIGKTLVSQNREEMVLKLVH